MRRNIQIFFYLFLMVAIMSSCTQSTDTKNQDSELISYEKKPNDVIKSLEVLT